MTLSLIEATTTGLNGISLGPLLIGLTFFIAATTLAYYRPYRVQSRHLYEMVTIGAATLAPGIPIGAATTRLALQTPGTYPRIKLTMLFIGLSIGCVYGYLLTNISNINLKRQKKLPS